MKRLANLFLSMALSATSLLGQFSHFRGIWWKVCDQDTRYDSAYDTKHSYGKDSILGGWKIEEVNKFAESGDACMQAVLGALYSHLEIWNTSMDSVPLNWTQSAKWFRLAAEQGHGDAQEKLAGAYWSGRGVRQDYVEAAKWYGKAAEQGLPCSELQLGQMYRDGQGVNEDKVLAHAWMNIAAADVVNLGLSTELDEAHRDYCVRTAADERDRLAESLTSAQIDQAQALARVWKPHLSADPIPKRTYNYSVDLNQR